MRPAGTGDYQVLSPRRKQGSIPNALSAAKAATVTTAAPNAVDTAAIQPGSVTADKVPVRQLVRSVNAITDHVFLFEGEDISIVRDEATLTFNVSTIGNWVVTRAPSRALSTL